MIRILRKYPVGDSVEYDLSRIFFGKKIKSSVREDWMGYPGGNYFYTPIIVINEIEYLCTKKEGAQIISFKTKKEAKEYLNNEFSF